MNLGECGFFSEMINENIEQGINVIQEIVNAILNNVRKNQIHEFININPTHCVVPRKIFNIFIPIVEQLGFSVPKINFENISKKNLFENVSIEEKKILLVFFILGGFDLFPAKAQDNSFKNSDIKINNTLQKNIPPLQKSTKNVLEKEESFTKKNDTTEQKKVLTNNDTVTQKIIDDIENAYKNMNDQDYYQFMGVSAHADEQTITDEYLKRVKLWHTDRFLNKNISESIQNKAKELFQHCELIKNTLKNPVERKEYDIIQERKKQGLPTDPKLILEFESLFLKAKKLFQDGKANLAFPFLEKIFEVHQNDAEYLAYYGFSHYCVNKNVEEAKKYINQALKKKDQLAIGFEFLGRIERVEENYEKALKYFKKTLSIDENNINVQREIRMLEMKKNSVKSKESNISSFFKKILN